MSRECVFENIGTGFSSLEIIQEAPVKSVKLAETVRFEIP